jgi:hypothetical protein
VADPIFTNRRAQIVEIEGARALIRRVVTETDERGLSDEEKQELIQRLQNDVASLEEWWVKLKSR